MILSPNLRLFKLIKLPHRFQEDEVVNLEDVYIPDSYKEARTGAIYEDIKALDYSETLILQNLLVGKKALKSKWICRVKDNDQSIA